MGVTSLERYLDNQLIKGRAYFSREEALATLAVKPGALTAAITRLIGKQRLANPRHGFYLILRPEDQIAGAPEPARWIDPLMKHQGIDYRVSLLRAAALHGSSHQASMVFQVVVPKQLRPIAIGRHRVQFIYQSPTIFAKTNKRNWLVQLKTDAGYAKAAGIELTMLDCVRYFRKATGIDGIAQIIKDLGGSADPKSLAAAAAHYENACVRRLGYLLELAGHTRQAKALARFVGQAKVAIPLDPSVKALSKALAHVHEKNARWMLILNARVETDF